MVFDPSLLPQDADALDELVLASRLLGRDESLVLHGGGNTSVKAPWRDITGTSVDAIYVKGSGWDLATIDRPGFAPMPIDRLAALLELETLSDPDMMRELLSARLDPEAPAPSVESLLHAFLPHVAVMHSHADVIVTLTNLRDGESRIREVFGADVVVVPYVMPGFDLAREVRTTWPKQAHDGTVGMVLMNHGLFTFGSSCKEAYERHTQLIYRAQQFLDRLPKAQRQVAASTPCTCALELARMRKQLSEAAGKPMIVRRHKDEKVMSYVSRPDLATLSTRGPLTPDHVIRTKRIPLVGRDVSSFVEDYRQYFENNKHRARTEITMLDPSPRIVLDEQFGMLAVGASSKDADIAADIYHHTIEVITNAEDRLGGWAPLEAHHLFDVEYWDLEQAKLRRAAKPQPFTGQVAVVTGAASGIGKACAAALLARGAAVIGLDISPNVAETFASSSWRGIEVDVTDAEAQERSLDIAVDTFGGIDMAVLSAGIFGTTMPIAELDLQEFARVMRINLDATAISMKLLHPFLVESPVGGRMVLVGSKNVPAPGAGAAAYSASKAAATQLTRVAAIEWAKDGIRVNTVHPDAVFDTALWTEEVLANRAASYGMTVEQYKARNLLKMEITSAQVAETVTELLSPAFAATTGAQIAVDGGSERTL
jgi:rhamnose utilization protein RhaD (predicted bifunctional aldolase and dehydrogenase)/NAD(P)-dependent dehydrogenase (short-subunit alcohol dehydrogenase family)